MPAPFSKRLAREAAPARPDVRSSAQVQSAPPAAEAAPLKLPETPVVPDIGNASQQVAIPVAAPADVTQVLSPLEVTVEPAGAGAGPFSPSAGPLSCHAGVDRGNIAQVESPQGLEAQIAQFLADRGGNLSRPAARMRAFDDFARGRLVTLLGIGLSQRQAAAALGVSHTAIQGELARRPDLVEEITAARFQAQVEPLLVILRESKRSWRAATWLVNYLTRQIATREETPDEALVRARAGQLVRRDEQRADAKDQRDYERKLREREALRELNRKRAETQVRCGGPSARELRAFEAEQQKIEEIFAKLEAEAEAGEK